nr:MAG TPA: hypothetical protein [Caudoviricetes sp.]
MRKRDLHINPPPPLFTLGVSPPQPKAERRNPGP